MGSVEIGALIAVVGCFVGLAGWLAGRDKRIMNDGEWKGTVNTKLDDIKSSVSNTGTELAKINATMNEQGERLTAVESSAKQAHKRIDEIINDKRPD
jgi:outer membrane murein-binding lipoprotein Lpp